MARKKKETTDKQKPEFKKVIYASKKTKAVFDEEGKEVERAPIEPASEVRVGMEVIKLPDAKEQRAGFELEADKADLLVFNVPAYKFLKDKGE